MVMFYVCLENGGANGRYPLAKKYLYVTNDKSPKKAKLKRCFEAIIKGILLA
jgi:hypothetical protein